MSIDWSILHLIHDTMSCSALDYIMPKITALGNGGAIWAISAVAMLCTKKYRRYGAVLIAGLAIGVITGNLILKNLIARPRPCWLDTSVSLLIPAPTDYAFPSGHTLAAVIGAAVITKADRRFGIAAIPLCILIAFSRLYLYVHFPSDIAAAAVLGLVIAEFCMASSEALVSHVNMRREIHTAD